MVATSDNGTAMLGTMVLATFRRNTNITSTTSTIVRMSSNWTSLTEARIVVVRSVSTDTLTDEGNDVVSCGSSCLMRSTTAMMFAPGCRWMFRMTAGIS